MTIQDQIFLYCFLIYEPENEQILSFLPKERADMLQKEARRFDRFPKEVRITLVSKLLGYLVQHVRNQQMERIHPTWIAETLRNENSAIVSVILSHFSSDYRKQVVDLLGSGYSRPAALVTARVLDATFQLYCSRFVPMNAPWGESQLSVETLYLLKEEELLGFLKHIGIREIACALTMAGKDVLAALISRFPAELQEGFAKGIKSAKGDSAEKQRLATKRLSKYDLRSMPLGEAALKAGLTKLGIVLHNKPEAARRIAQRLSFKLGMVLLEAGKDTEVLEEERAELSSSILELIEQQKIDKHYIDSLFPTDVRSRPSAIN